jgi:signal transduction histidine kinase
MRSHDNVVFEVRASLLKTTADRLTPTVVMTLAVSIGFAWLLAPRFDSARIQWWLAAISGGALLRAALLHAFRRGNAYTPERVELWTRLFWLGSTVAAATWSLGAVLVFDEALPGEVTFLVITLLGVSAVASGTLACHWPSAAVFVLVTLAPTAARLIASPDPLMELNGLAMCAAVIGFIVTTLRLNKEMVRAIRSEIKLVAAVHEAETARAAAEAADRAKGTFLANMSHEFRTPLNAIIGYGDLLSEDARNQGDAGQTADLNTITTEARRLLTLITNVLDMAALDAGRLDLSPKPVDAGAVVRRAVAMAQDLAAAGGNRLVASGIDQLGVVYADPERLHQVLLHLIENACKFTHEGTVHVACARRCEQEDEWLEVSVIDSGIGMSPDEADLAFKTFTQVDGSFTRRAGGTGLGLSLSRQLCVLMGGTLTASSVPGQGSTFTVRVPAGPPAANIEPVRMSVFGNSGAE